MSRSPRVDPTVAIVCAGVGSTWRGFERFALELHQALSPIVPTSLLCAGSSPPVGAQRLRAVSRTAPLPSWLPPRSRWWSSDEERALVIESHSFAAAAAAHLARHPVDVVICPEPLVARRLFQLRRLLGRRSPVIVHVDGLGLAPAHLLGIADLVQVMTPEREAALLAAGARRERTISLPYGVDVDAHARPHPERARRRADLMIGAADHVLLSVAAVNRRHKRIDHLVAEVARSAFSGTLVLCGALEEPSILDEAQLLLGDRVRHLYVPPEDMPAVYDMADRFVLTSLEEGLCLAAVEAMAAGLPVVAHDSPHFRWLLGNAGTFVDMSVPGALGRALELPVGTSPADALQQARTFAWPALLPRYLELVDRAAALA